MMAKWSPKNSSLVIVDNYNLYYIPTVAKPNHVKQLTFHGSKDFFNGIPDWVYQGKCENQVIIITMIFRSPIKVSRGILYTNYS